YVGKLEDEISKLPADDEFLGSVIQHDMINYLTIAQGFLEIGEDSGNSSYLERAEAAARKVSRNIEEYKILSKPFKPEKILVGGLLYDSALDVIGIYGDNYTEYILHLEPVKVVADRGLGLVFDNLYSNSLKHSEKPLKIVTRVKEEKEAVIEIMDNGKGIPDEEKSEMFNRPGRGMYITKKLIEERYGGTIEVSDRFPGKSEKGTKFTLRLPKG
ncbi:MAG: hypothetical protein DRP11_05255, partial [Candidatus Aenigmatarchaeota archaeon]